MGKTESDLDVQLQASKLLDKYELDFPPVDQPAIQEAVRHILTAVGEDPTREGLLNTPKRVAGAYTELLSGYRTNPAELLATKT